MACASHLGDCELHGRRLERGYSVLSAAYMLSLLSTWLCHRVRPRAALGNLIVMIAYNAILSYNLVFNSRYGAGLTWWLFALLLNAIHSIGLLIYTSTIRFIKKHN